jgi:hypothetical protein
VKGPVERDLRINGSGKIKMNRRNRRQIFGMGSENSGYGGVVLEKEFVDRMNRLVP